MHDIGKLGEGGVAAHQGANLLHDIGGMWPEDVTTDDSPAWVGKQFQHSFGLVHGYRLTVGAEERLAADVFCATLLAHIFAHAYACCLGTSENGGGHDVKTYVARLPKDFIHHLYSLHRGGMSQHLTAVHVADGVDALYVGAHVVVGSDALWRVFHACCLKGKPFQVRHPARCHENGLGVYCLFLALALECHAVGSDTFHGRLHVERDALLLHRLAQTLGDVAVYCRQTFLEELHDRHLAAETVEDRGELHSYDSRSNDNDTLWNMVEAQHLGRCGHHTHVDVTMWRHLRLRACGYDNIRGGMFLAVHDNGMSVLEGSMPVNHRYSRHLHQLLDARAQLRYDLLEPLGYMRVINLGRRNGCAQGLENFNLMA